MPTTTLAFGVITALVDVCREQAADGVIVKRGWILGSDYGNFLMVNVGNPFDNSGTAESAAGTQEWAGLGARATYEDGVIPCCALAWSGDSDEDAQQRMDDEVAAIVSGVDQTLRNDPNLGGAVPGLNWVRYGSTFAGPTPLSDDSGTASLFGFQVAYKGRLV